LILVDADLLLYAYDADSRMHAAARTWLETQLHGVRRVGLPWPSLLAFLRVVTNPRVYRRPARVGAAWRQVESWLAAEPSWVPQPTERHAETLGTLLRAVEAAADLVPDAHLAALAIEHGLTLCSTDADFAQFPGLSWENPLVP
jgi:toxin-antitoxin system PIN domain toxin